MRTNEKLKVRGDVVIFSRPTPKGVYPRLLRFLARACREFRFIKMAERIEKEYFSKKGWKEEQRKHNLIVNTGYNTIANRLTGQAAYSSTTFQYFAYGDGTTAPALTDTATTFYADCANSATKAVTSYDAFNTTTRTQTWNCFLSSTDNAVASIWKLALMNTTPGTVMFNTIKFTSVVSKNSNKELYFRYSLTMSQI